MTDYTAKKKKRQIWKTYNNFTGKEPLKSVTEKEHQKHQPACKGFRFQPKLMRRVICKMLQIKSCVRCLNELLSDHAISFATLLRDRIAPYLSVVFS